MGCGSVKPVNVLETEQLNSSKIHSRTSSISEGHTDITKLYRRANYLIQNEKYEQSTQLLNRILETDPDFVNAIYSKGIVELCQNKLDKAKKYFLTSLEKQPNHALALNELASLMIKEKQYNEALLNLEKGFQIDPNIPDLNYGLGYVLARLKRKTEAIQYFDMAIKQDPNQKHFYVSKATTLSDLKQFDKALEAVQIALKIDPQYIDGYQVLAYIYRHQKQYDKMEEACDVVLKLDAQNQYALNCKQESKKQNQLKQPPVPLESISVEDQLKEVRNLQVGQQHTLALSLLNQILEKDPVQLDALKLKAQIQIELKQQASGLVTLNQILSIQQNDLDALKEKGINIHSMDLVKILEYMNKSEEVLKCYELILSKETNFEFLEKKASTLIKLNRLQEASKIYEYLQSQSNQNDSKIFIIRGRLFQAQKKYEDAIICLNDGLTKFPQNLEILDLLAQMYKITKKEQKALEIYEKILSIDTTNEQYLYEKGSILFNQKNYNESFDIFLELKNSEYAQNLNYYLGFCYNQKKEYVEALKQLNLYLKTGKDNLEQVYFIIGTANQFLMKFDEAIDGYQNCISQNPKNSEAYFQLGNVYKQDKQIEDAQKAFEQAVKINPSNSVYKQALGIYKLKLQLDNITNEKSFLQEYRNSLLFTLITFIGSCQLDPKSPDFDKQQNEKYLTLLTLMEAHLKKRFNTLDKHFEQLKELIGKSYDMKLTLIDDTLFPIMQFWHNQKICKKKKDNNDLVVSMINSVKSMINSNNEKILNSIQNEKSLNNRFCVEFLSKSQHESYQKVSGNAGLQDGIKILGFLIKYHKEFNSETKSFPEFIANKYVADEIQIFHDSYYRPND
ncbi:unnamed protein product (macronuclear) [Paramecium tetraurelia]|uniref:Uncharacterized protein n=1 Tax=Paramecium tetraurelia TaxID=5888 RepID=A0E357_PARTE|nr:uncharacterized protein GSPATT00022897001 [Paramecium tetraurelia]CAK89724.1 unnamed protein product [Paramecium tetraurelia]|eukprot:XP_001457121.1 hypothetical protein (macronuclear) [Paramecium tetraurelia strain d4-2]